MDRRTWAGLALIAAITGGISYMASWSVSLSSLALSHPASFPKPVSLAWKGTGVGFLALYAAVQARNLDGWLLTAVMALGAAGDVLLGAAGQTVGGAIFLAGHIAAIVLYRRNLRAGLGVRPVALAGLLVVAGATVAYLLPPDRSAAVGIAIYALGGALAAAAAWLSRFPRRVAVGATMFLVSDELIFARMGPLHGQPWVDYAVWGLYFAGQALIATGVAGTLAAEA